MTTAKPVNGYPFSQPAKDIQAITAEIKEKTRRSELTEIVKDRIISKQDGEKAAELELAASRVLVVTTASSVKPVRTRWLWDERVPIGEITLIAGRGGTGKSSMLARIAADVTNGNLQGEYSEPKSVLYVVNEDSLERTVTPRMIAAGANLDRIHYIGIDESVIQLPRDCERIAEAARKYDACCVMIDPLSANLGELRNDQIKTRIAMQYVQKMCIENDLAAIGLAHTRKAMTNNLLDAILGSTEMANVARSAMGVVLNPDEENTYILSQEKSNLGRMDIDSYTYKIEGFSFMEGPELIKTSRIEITGTTRVKVSDVLAEASLSDGGQMSDAKKFLSEYLEKEGTAAAKDVKAAAREEGISESSLQRARKSLNIHVERSGFGKTMISTWSLAPALVSPPATL